MKEFLDIYKVRNDALLLADRIYNDGFIPDVIYVLLRGGSNMGNVISEYFKIKRKDQKPVFFAAVSARSYTDVKSASAVKVDGWTYAPEHLRPGDKVLLIDDIFDTGKTLNHIAKVIIDKGVERENLKIAVHDFKIKKHDKAQCSQPIMPDYYSRKFIINSPEEDHWIHYLSHELVGLTKDEFKKNYVERFPELDCINLWD